MKKTAKDLVFPQLAQWVVNHAKKSENPYIRVSAKEINHGLSLLKKLPDEYRWFYSSSEAFKSKIVGLRLSNISKPIEYNRVIWDDHARNWEAYAIMSYWRGVELINPAIRSLNLKEMVAVAVLSRSLLELSATFLMNANIFCRCVEELPDLHPNIAASGDLDLLTNKAIWGSRLVEKNDPLIAKNIITTLQKVSKHPNATELYPTYECLCEVAHPNMMGNARFWSHIESVDSHGYENRVIQRFADADHAHELLENSLWALAWGSVAIYNSFQLVSTSVRSLTDKLK